MTVWLCVYLFYFFVVRKFLLKKNIYLLIWLNYLFHLDELLSKTHPLQNMVISFSVQVWNSMSTKCFILVQHPPTRLNTCWKSFKWHRWCQHSPGFQPGIFSFHNLWKRGHSPEWVWKELQVKTLGVQTCTIFHPCAKNEHDWKKVKLASSLTKELHLNLKTKTRWFAPLKRKSSAWNIDIYTLALPLSSRISLFLGRGK